MEETSIRLQVQEANLKGCTTPPTQRLEKAKPRREQELRGCPRLGDGGRAGAARGCWGRETGVQGASSRICPNPRDAQRQEREGEVWM